MGKEVVWEEGVQGAHSPCELFPVVLSSPRGSCAQQGCPNCALPSKPRWQWEGDCKSSLCPFPVLPP